MLPTFIKVNAFISSEQTILVNVNTSHIITLSGYPYEDDRATGTLIKTTTSEFSVKENIEEIGELTKKAHDQQLRSIAETFARHIGTYWKMAI